MFRFFRLCQKENELVPVGVFNELAPERPGLLSDRLSAGLVRALIAAGLDFESLQDAMISRGVKGLLDELILNKELKQLSVSIILFYKILLFEE